MVPTPIHRVRTWSLTATALVTGCLLCPILPADDAPAKKLHGKVGEGADVDFDTKSPKPGSAGESASAKEPALADDAAAPVDDAAGADDAAVAGDKTATDGGPVAKSSSKSKSSSKKKATKAKKSGKKGDDALDEGLAGAAGKPAGAKGKAGAGLASGGGNGAGNAGAGNGGAGNFGGGAGGGRVVSGPAAAGLASGIADQIAINQAIAGAATAGGERGVLGTLIDLINQERQTIPPPPHGSRAPDLVTHPILMKMAQEQAAAMAAQKSLSHSVTDPFIDRLKETTYLGTATENIAAGQKTPEEVFEDWMDTREGRIRLLSSFLHIGVAVSESDDGTLYWVAILGRPFQPNPLLPNLPKQTEIIIRFP